MQSGANNKLPPWQSDSPEGEAISFGTWLRRQREIREIPLHEIADVTKIGIRYLEALEQDRFDILPAPVFAKGFLREYARYVGLDPDEVINSYLTTQQEESDQEVDESVVPADSSRSTATLLGAGLVILLAVVAGLIFYSERFRGDAREAPPPAIAAPPAPAPEPVPERVLESPQPAPPAAAESVAPLLVTMDFTEDCWVELVVDGRRRISELHVQGESLRIEAQEEVVLLTLGNPAGVRIEVNGEPFDPELRQDRVAHDIVISVEALEGAGTPTEAQS